jgi:hypothetical protein
MAQSPSGRCRAVIPDARDYFRSYGSQESIVDKSTSIPEVARRRRGGRRSLWAGEALL